MTTRKPSSSVRINIAASAQKIDVDNRISLKTYYRIADDILKKADIYREEKSTIDLYIMLLRFSSLITETIPYHRDYKAPLERNNFYVKKLLSALAELEELKPAVKQKIEELNRRHAYQVNKWGNHHQNNSQKQNSNCYGLTKVLPSQLPQSIQNPVPPTVIQTAVNATELVVESNNASVQSALEGRKLLIPSNHPIPEAGKANGRDNVSSESSHFGLDYSIGSTGISDQVWVDKPAEAARYNGWGESATECKDNNEKCSSDKPTPPEVSSSGWMDEPIKDEYNGWGVPQSMPDDNPIEDTQIGDGIQPLINSNHDSPTFVPIAPSAPPLPEEILYEGIDHSPAVDSSPVDLVVTSKMREASISDAREENSSYLCIICWEAPVEGACVPCGHMAGCMTCLHEIKSKKGDCPVCRAKIDQVIKLYVV